MLNHTNPEMKPMIDEKDWPKMFESIKQYFTLKHSKLRICLVAYVIREQVTPPPATDDPAGNYAMLVAEMIACALMKGMANWTLSSLSTVEWFLTTSLTCFMIPCLGCT
jgi:hypothetical protein